METGRHNTGTWKTIMKLVGLLMAFLYLFMGVFIIAYGARMLAIAPHYRVLLGTLLVAYGGFRCYRIYRNSKQEDE